MSYAYCKEHGMAWKMPCSLCHFGVNGMWKRMKDRLDIECILQKDLPEQNIKK